MATCAICQQPLTREQGIAIAGSETFHKACVRQHGISNSVVARLRARLAELETAAVRTQEDLRRRLDEVTSKLKEVARSKVELEQRMQDMHRVENDLALKKLELASVRSELRTARDELRQSEDLSIELAQERDAARREAALHQLLAQQAPVQKSTPEHDERDATEVRFSLLELDEK